MTGAHAGRPKVGEKVSITHIAGKDFVPYDKTEWVSFPLPKIREGIYIGYRTKFNGYTISDEGHRDFVPEQGVRVWMVVVDERENPVPVFPEHVIRIKD